MKLLFLMTVALSFNLSVALWAEDHSATGSDSQRAATNTPQSKLFDYLSACLAGRPIDPSINLPSTPSAGARSVVTTNAGEGVFRTECLRCHSSAGPARTNLTLLTSTSATKAIAEINSGRMPQDKRPISDADKAELIKYLQSIK